MSIFLNNSLKGTNKSITKSFAVKLLIMDFFLLVLTYGGFYRCFFANSDTLWGALSPSSTFKARLDCYRWIPAIIEFFINRTDFLPALHFRLSLVAFIVALSISLYLMQIFYLDLFNSYFGLCDEWTGIRISVIVAVCLSYVNVLFVEFFYFTESFYIFGLAFMFMGTGCYMISRKHLGLSLLLFFCMTMCYQMACPIASICVGVYVYLEHKGKLSFALVKDVFIKALPPMFLFVFNYLTGPWVQGILAKFGIESYQEKNIVGYSFNEFITAVLSSVRELISSNIGLTPPVYSSIIVILISFAVIAFLCIKHKKWGDLFTFILVEVILVTLVLVVQIVSNPKEFTARTVSTLSFAQSMQLIMMFFWLAANDNGVKSFFGKTAKLVPVVIVLFNFFFIQCIIENRLVSETLDSIYATRIFDMIENYESETGITVKNIAVTNDIDSPPFYDQVHFCSGAVNRRCYSDYTWTFLQYCAYNTDLAGNITGRSFNHVDMDSEIYEEYFKGKNWTYFDVYEQVIFCGETAYICVF